MQVVDEFSEVMSFWWLVSPWASLSHKKFDSVNTLPHGLFSWICSKECDLPEWVNHTLCVICVINDKILVMRSFTNTLPLLPVMTGKSSVLLGMLLTARREWQHMA